MAVGYHQWVVVECDIKGALGSAQSDEPATQIVRTDISLPGKGDRNVVTTGNRTSVTAVFESTRELVPHKYAGDAFAISEIDTATDRFA